MKKGFLCTAIVLAAIFTACGKEDAPVVTEQPAFGEDIAGYAGFANLTSYTLVSEGKETVVYLPTDEGAYVGETSAIATKDGVECKVNLNPMYSDDTKDLPLDKKLKKTIEREFVKKADDFSDLAISDVDTAGDLGVDATVSYLVFNDSAKAYDGTWVYLSGFMLEDGREINIRLTVNSAAETANTAAVISDMENYLCVDIPYETGMLSEKIASYVPGEEEAVKNAATAVEIGDLVLHVPTGYEENEMFSSFIAGFTSAMNGVDADSLKIFVPEDFMDASRSSDDFDMIMIFEQTNTGLSTGELGKYNDGQLSTVARYMADAMESAMPGSNLKGEIERNDVGHGIKITGSGFVMDQETTCDGAIYYIIRGERNYAIAGLTKSGSGRKDEIIEAVDYTYESVEVK
ncbi:MAG: hypothetical protein K6G07_03740 [Lachnospiraceae bacterium]|nr:hypothetical protein [Lachnospiraceae bacterium]